MSWSDFEVYCVEYLRKKYGESFRHQGMSNSTMSDIQFDDGEINFAIECKEPEAQSGQFVLLPNVDVKCFEFSPRNKTPFELRGTKDIINYLDKHFDEFVNPGRMGLDVPLSPKIFAEWIIDMYRTKNVEFIITSTNKDEYEGNLIILPLEEIGDYFDISCKYRVKKSGSSKINKKTYADLCDSLESKEINFIKREDLQIYTEDKFPFEIHNSEQRGYKFQLNFNEPEFTYTVRALSTTYNANIIFSLKLKNGVKQDEEVLKRFERRIKK